MPSLARTAVLALAFAAMGAAAATADPARAMAQFRALVPAVPAEGLLYANALEMAGMPERAADLRLAMFTAHVDQLNGRPPPAGVTLGAAMDGAKLLPPARPGTALSSAWTLAFQRHVALDWSAGELPVAYRWQAHRLQAVRRGGWMQTSGARPLQYVATVELAQRGPTPITLTAFRLQWSEGLVLDCEPATLGTKDRDPVRAFACGGQGPPLMQEPFRTGTPVIVPRHLESPDRYRDLLYAIASSERIDLRDWVARLRGEPGAQARVAAQDTERRVASRAASGREWRQHLGRALSGALVVGLVLGVFVVGRRWRREGSDETTIGLMSLLALAGIALVVSVGHWQSPSGEGWARGASFFLAVWVIGCCAAAGLVLRLLHGMDRLLLQERLAWSATVRDAWRRLADFGGSATKAQFRGYMGFCFAAMLCVGLVVPQASFVTLLLLLLLLPMPALLWRRLRGLSAREAWVLVAGVVALWLLVLVLRR